MKQLKNILLIVALSIALFACGDKQNSGDSDTALDEGKIEITTEQFKSGAMAIGTITSQTFAEEISCRGFLSAPANAMAKVSAPISGAVQNVLFMVGSPIQKGQTLCTISGDEFLSLQQQYAEAAALYQKAKADYDRMKALQAENIGAKKDYLSAESIYKTSLASYKALKARIQALNISPQRIEEGQMYSAFPIVSPISGYITTSGVIVGQYIDRSSEVAQVVNVDQLQLRLSVFDADITRLSEGQTVRFALTSNPNDIMTATLTTIGKAINPDTKSIDCIAQINDEDKQRLVSDSYVEARIVVNQKEALALPISAVQKEGNDYFVYIVEGEKEGNYTLARTQVQVGNISSEYIEIVGGIPSGAQVLTQGVATL